MPEYIPFARNYADRSTSYAYQFEFFCWRCGSGYLSDQEIVSATGAAAGGLAAKKAA